MKHLSLPLVLISLVLIISCTPAEKSNNIEQISAAEVQATSLLNEPLYASEPSEALLQKYEMHKANYEADPENADKLIWYGRFAAYKGDYKSALNIYKQGMEKFPDDARMYRHSGHRHISIRKFDEAIADFEKAASLIEGKENEIEPDGMPNAQNIPVSTLHGNIWYHLGLAYYLKHDFPKALAAYKNCLATSSNPDNVVSATNWLYMISRRMGDEAGAVAYLDNIDLDMEIIENFNYHHIDLFYKGELSLEELEKKAEAPGAGADAIHYALANWHYYHGKKDEAKKLYEKILAGTSWSSFGFIAAESDYAAMTK